MADLLIVDDDAMIAETVADILADEGHTVRMGHDGAEGLGLMAQRLPDLVVLDVEMPQLSGPEMAHRMVVENAGRERIPIVLLSGAAYLERVAAMVGTPYALTKPCQLDTLLQTMRRALAERRAPQPGPGRTGPAPARIPSTQSK